MLDIVGQGNCLFQALADCLNTDGVSSWNHFHLRASIVARLRRHAARYEPYWDKLAPAA